MSDAVMLQVTAFADAATGGDLARPVPTCPDWTLRDLARHLGRVHRCVAATVASGAERLVRHDDVPDAEPPGPRDEVATWLLAGGAAVASALREAGPDRLVAGFLGPVPASWWQRRMLHETLVHRYDAEAAVGVTPWAGVTPALAADGIAESLGLLEMFGPRRPDLAGTGETIHVHATDEPSCEWLVTRAPSGVEITAGHTKADVAVRGPAAALYAVLTNRRAVGGPEDGPGAVDVFGDAGVLADWLRVSAL